MNTKFIKAFSLVEMLVVLAVIGIIAAIAIPSISSINEASRKADEARKWTDMENARAIVAIFNDGIDAGIDWATGNERIDILLRIRGGVQIKKGPRAGEVLILREIFSSDFSRATKYVGFDGKRLYIDDTMGQTPIEL